MSFYDNYLNRSSITSLGKYLVQFWNRFFITQIKIALSMLPENITILEIGPGKGYFSREALKQNLNYSAIEVNATLAENLRIDGIKVTTAQVPPLKINKKVDAIFMDQVFEHMSDWSIASKLLQDFHKILNPFGVVVISCPDIDYWGSDFFAGDYTHTFPTTIRTLTQIAEDNDFEILDSNSFTLFTTNSFLCRIVTLLTKIAYSSGIFGLFFGNKAFKIKSSLLPSCYVILRKI